MVALGVALALSVAVLDSGIGGRIGLVFDLAFVGVCVLVALLVRPEDFFTVGVLPPLILLAVLVLFGISHRVAIAPDDHGLAQAVVTALAQHAIALGIGYAACLGCLAIRDHVLRSRAEPAARRYV
jgi:hypothetical protein